jgi:hypothetical protein
MIHNRLPLALLLAMTLLVPAEAHVVTGGCLAGFHTVTPASMSMQAQLPAPSHQAASCATHHQGERPVRGGMQHCSTPSTCAASVALLENHASLREWQAKTAGPVLFPTMPSSRVAPPATPPPRY